MLSEKYQKSKFRNDMIMFGDEVFYHFTEYDLQSLVYIYIFFKKIQDNKKLLT